MISVEISLQVHGGYSLGPCPVTHGSGTAYVNKPCRLLCGFPCLWVGRVQGGAVFGICTPQEAPCAASPNPQGTGPTFH